MAKNFKSYINSDDTFELKEKGKATFYVDLNVEDKDQNENDEELEKEASAFFYNPLEPKMLQGERVIASAQSVLMFTPFSDMKQGISGNLFVTNFKISFATADKSSYPDGHSNTKLPQRNKLLENGDVPLTAVDSVYSVGSGTRKKKLSPHEHVSSSMKYLEIHRKDFQVHVFGFKFTQKDERREVTDAIMTHAFPDKDSGLFAYSFGQHANIKVKRMINGEDWDKELERLQCNTMWRVTSVNNNHLRSQNLPEYFVIPNKLFDTDLSRIIDQSKIFSIPTWSYTYMNGASLIRMAQNSVESDSSLRKKMEDAIKEASGNNKDLMTLDLGIQCPSIVDIRNAFEKLKNIVMTDSAPDFLRSDSRWLSNLENSQWLQHVSTCLNTANLTVTQLVRECQTVILKEETGTDLNCVISCLAQIQIDPEYRTIQGFESLIEREWVTMGHQFQRRLCLVYRNESVDTKVIPVFLLFLDCVWQLVQQFPSSFAFTETYLTTLWDTLHIGIFYNFLFNSSHHMRHYGGDRKNVLSLPSAWDWTFQLSEEQLMLFNNPLYMLRRSFDLDNVVNGAKTALRLSGESLTGNEYRMNLGHHSEVPDFFCMEDSVLKPEVTPSLIKFWSQCFLRWVVPAQIIGGGNPSRYLQQCVLAEEVICYEYKLRLITKQLEELKNGNSKGGQQETSAELDQGDGIAAQIRSDVRKTSRPQSGLVFGANGYQSRGTSLTSVYITSSYPFSPGVSQTSQHSFICGPLSHYLKDTAIDHDYNLDEDD